MKLILNIICHFQTEPMADLRHLALKNAFNPTTFFKFTEEVIAQLHALHQYRTAETYQAALNSFRQFRRGKDLPPDAIDADLVQAYEAHLKFKGLNMNTISFTTASCAPSTTAPSTKA